MFFIYVLRSLKNGRMYTGSTNDLARRLEEHNSGRSKYTKLILPVELLYTEEYRTKPEAYRRELYLKTGQGREYLKKVFRARA